LSELKTLVVYYSASGNTRKAAEAVAAALHADIEEIRVVTPVKAGSGGLGRLVNLAWVSVKAIRDRPVELEPMSRDPSAYCLLVVGTPVHGGTVSLPVRTDLEQHGPRLPEVAFFCTGGGAENPQVIDQMQDIAGKPPKASAVFQGSAVQSGKHRSRLDEFLAALQGGDAAPAPAE
jgi:hypothetical protein